MAADPAYLILAEPVRVMELRHDGVTEKCPVADARVVVMFDAWVQLAVTLPCPSNSITPAISTSPVVEAPERELPVPLKGQAPASVLTAQACRCTLPAPL